MAAPTLKILETPISQHAVKGRMVLLIDHHTRSGAEMVAFGFRRAELGIIVGTQTAGAVAAGRLFPTPSGGLLYLAMYLPILDGQTFDQVGIEPDIFVPMPLSYSAGADPQLEAAIQIAVELVEGR